MSADGTAAFPAVWKLVRLTGLAERTIRQALSELRGDPVKKGGPRRDRWLKGTARNKGGRQVSSTYDAVSPPASRMTGATHFTMMTTGRLLRRLWTA